MTSSASLLREWDLLQEAIMPPLLAVAPRRPPAVWAIGPAEDAVALALAYHHAAGDPETADIKVFLSGSRPRGGRMHFALSDLLCLPADRREAFVHVDRRWMPVPRLTQRVVLGRPVEPVDLLAVRVHRATGPARPELDHLRRGGLLFFVGDPPPGPVPTTDFRALDGAGRLFTRTTDAPSARPAPGVAADGTLLTLAARLQQEKLVESHANLARSLARRFAHHGEMTEDLEQVALLALVKAAGRYSDDHGSSFATYATASVLGELKRHFRDKTWMLRVPRSLQETYLAIKTAREELGQKLGASPTIPQIAAHLRVSEEAVLAAMEAGDSYWPASLDTARRDGDDPGTEVPVIEHGFESSLDRRQLRETLPTLGPREQHIIKRLYFDGWTQRRVAEEIGVSQMQVSRLMARTLETLRAAFEGG